jgi:outer membrane protein assembly factor BamB
MARADPENTGQIQVDLDWDSATVRRVISDATTDRRPVSSLTVANDSLASVVGDTTILVWDLSTGEEAWRYETDSGVASAPALANETLYISTTERVLALDLTSGTLRWQADVASLDVPLLPHRGRLIVEDKTEPELVGLDALSGRREWSRSTDYSPQGVARTAGQTFVTQRSEEVGLVTYVDGESGETRWERQFAPIVTPPVVADDVIVVGTKAGTVRALDRADGTTVWKRSVISAPEGIFVPLATDGRSVYVPPNNGDELVALDLADGTDRWRASVGMSGLSAAIAGNAVLLPRRDELLVRSKSSGETIRTIKFRTEILSVCPSSRGVFVASGDTVFRLGRE